MAKSTQKLDFDCCGVCNFCHMVDRQYKCYVGPALRDEVTGATIRGVTIDDPRDPPCEKFRLRKNDAPLS